MDGGEGIPRSCGKLAEQVRGDGGAYPDVEVQVLVGDGLNVEADGWNGCDDLADLSSQV